MPDNNANTTIWDQPTIATAWRNDGYSGDRNELDICLFNGQAWGRYQRSGYNAALCLDARKYADAAELAFYLGRGWVANLHGVKLA